MDARLETLSKDLVKLAVDRLEKRVERLKSRRFVLFPYLRARMILKKIAFLKGF